MMLSLESSAQIALAHNRGRQASYSARTMAKPDGVKIATLIKSLWSHASLICINRSKADPQQAAPEDGPTGD
jgi:hypothetical protein